MSETSQTNRSRRTNGPSNTSPRIEFVWRPQTGPQKALIDCTLPEVFYGGARGGGKTDGVLGKWALKEKRYGAAFNAVMFRRTTVSSEDAIERAKALFLPLGARFVGSPLPRFKMPNGGRVLFSYLDSTIDAEGQQGKNLTDIWVEEVGQYPTPEPVDRLWGALRGVPWVQMILTGNPGGAGQMWVADRYGLIPFPLSPKVVTRQLPNGKLHRTAVIPSRITDNRIMLHNDPTYIDRLHMSGGPALVKAWVDGDWSAIEGAYFPEWSEAKHVVAPFEIPAHWARLCSFDWGSASPFSVGWWAVASADTQRPEGVIPKGAMIRYREWYGASGPNRGVKMTNVDVAKGILALEPKGEEISLRVADPAIFAEDGGPSIAESFGDHGVHWSPADNKRVAAHGHIGGWEEVRRRLVGFDGRPMLYSFVTCKDYNRQMPALQHDPTKAEDVDTDMEDHAADEGRYACMARPWTAPAPVKPRRRDMWADAEGDEASWRVA